MIDLTPLEVRQKKGDFRRAMRGYDPELVNDFLDLVADRMEELVKQNLTLVDRLQEVEAEAASYQEKERALSDALMTAQRLREDARSHAAKEGELMLREARLAAEEAHKEAARAIIREEEALRQVRARRSQLVQSFRRLLERELTELTVIEEALELEPPPAGRAGVGAGAAKARASESTGDPDDVAASGEAGASGKAGAADKSGAPGKAGAPGRADAEPKAPAADAARAAKPTGEKAAEADPESRRGEAEGEADAQADWLSSLVEE